MTEIDLAKILAAMPDALCESKESGDDEGNCNGFEYVAIIATEQRKQHRRQVMIDRLRRERVRMVVFDLADPPSYATLRTALASGEPIQVQLAGMDAPVMFMPSGIEAESALHDYLWLKGVVGTYPARLGRTKYPSFYSGQLQIEFAAELPSWREQHSG